MIKRNNIYCHTECAVTQYLSFKKGMYYDTVVSYNNKIITATGKIHLRCYQEHCVIFDYPEEFNKYFCTDKQLRMNKLKKLETV